MSDNRCGNCVHWNGTEREDTHGDCPFFVGQTAREWMCDRWFGKTQLYATAYGRKTKPEPEPTPQGGLDL